MQYVPFGRTGRQVSRLGFGMMRLPTIKKEDGSEPVDREEAVRMLRYGIDHGINYVDTAYGYHQGESEVVTGLGLRDGYREKVMLTTKLPHWLAKKEGDFDRLLDEQLNKLGVSYLDFYLLHALNSDTFKRVQGLEYRTFLDRAKADGRIRHAGFSYHGDKETFPRIIDDYSWDMAQIQLNYLDDEYQATLHGARYAGRQGVPVVVMEPLRGGVLANPPDNVRALMDGHKSHRSPVEWAFAYVGDLKEVAVILSGMTTMDQVKDNLRVFEGIKPLSLDAQDQAFIASLKEAYLSRVKIGCTACNYCQPCPQGVQIPRIFGIYNESYKLNDPGTLKWNYAGVMRDGADGSLCVECGQCEAVCPQQLPIIESLKVIHAEAQ